MRPIVLCEHDTAEATTDPIPEAPDVPQGSGDGDDAPTLGPGDTGDPGTGGGTEPDPPSTWTCITAARNGAEICDDEAFDVPGPYVPMALVCETGEGGIGYIATNTGPVMDDGISRCQGWEEGGQDAWDHLDYVASIECTYDGQVIDIDLSAWEGGWLYMGVHDNPAGGGHMTQVCVATWD